jgi:hypothetical protein
LQGGVVPSSSGVFLDARLEDACGNNWTDRRSMPRKMSDFNSLIYSLEIMITAI